MKTIFPTYDVYTTFNEIQQFLTKLKQESVVAFDTETRSIYSNAQIAEAKTFIESPDFKLLPREDQSKIITVANSSGLSSPEIIKTTHFIFSTSISHSTIIVCISKEIEYALWEWLVQYQGTLIIHNTLFDLKICYHRTKQLPANYEDTMLMIRQLTNDANSMKSKCGLKHLMSIYYDPRWGLTKGDDYTNEDFFDKDFLDYCACDGAATWDLYHLILNKIGKV